MVWDTLYGVDNQFRAQPQMVAGDKTENDGKTWELTLRDGLKFHDGEKVLAKDCVATIKRMPFDRPPVASFFAQWIERFSAPKPARSFGATSCASSMTR